MSERTQVRVMNFYALGADTEKVGCGLASDLSFRPTKQSSTFVLQTSTPSISPQAHPSIDSQELSGHLSNVQKSSCSISSRCGCPSEGRIGMSLPMPAKLHIPLPSQNIDLFGFN